jgi:hypothetical protein
MTFMSKTNFPRNPIGALLLLGACQDRSQSSAGPSSAVSTSSDNQTTARSHVNNLTDQWLGQWNRPEGTFLLVSKNGDKYVVEVHSLDGSATHTGVAAGDHIICKRDGKTETIRTGSGAETGMKWLLEEELPDHQSRRRIFSGLIRAVRDSVLASA